MPAFFGLSVSLASGARHSRPHGPVTWFFLLVPGNTTDVCAIGLSRAVSSREACPMVIWLRPLPNLSACPGQTQSWIHVRCEHNPSLSPPSIPYPWHGLRGRTTYSSVLIHYQTVSTRCYSSLIQGSITTATLHRSYLTSPPYVLLRPKRR